MVWTWRGYERKTVEYLTKERPDSSRQVLRSAWGQTESKIRFGSGPGWPKLSDGSAAFFDSIFDLEPGHRPKPSNRTEIRFAKPLYYRLCFVTCVVPALCQIMYSLSVCSDGTTSAAHRSFRQNSPPARTLSLTENESSWLLWCLCQSESGGKCASE